MKDVVIVLLIAVLIFFIFSDARYTKTDPIIVADTVYQQKTYTKFIKGNNIPFVVLDTTYLIEEIHDTITIVFSSRSLSSLSILSSISRNPLFDANV